jgi:hypothetical protein
MDIVLRYPRFFLFGYRSPQSTRSGLVRPFSPGEAARLLMGGVKLRFVSRLRQATSSNGVGLSVPFGWNQDICHIESQKKPDLAVLPSRQRQDDRWLRYIVSGNVDLQ